MTRPLGRCRGCRGRWASHWVVVEVTGGGSGSGCGSGNYLVVAVVVVLVLAVISDVFLEDAGGTRSEAAVLTHEEAVTCRTELNRLSPA